MQLFKVNVKYQIQPLRTVNGAEIPVTSHKVYYMTGEELTKLQDAAQENDIVVELLHYASTSAKGVLNELPALKKANVNGW